MPVSRRDALMPESEIQIGNNLTLQHKSQVTEAEPLARPRAVLPCFYSLTLETKSI